MYTLSEIKDIRRKYNLNKTGELEPTGKEQVKSVSEMTAEEKSYIESAIFLFRQVRNRARDNHPLSSLSDEEFLQQIQSEFIAEALSSNEYSTGYVKDGHKNSQKASHLIWKPIIDEEAGSMAYFMRVLSENGKRLQMFQRYQLKGMKSGIKYDLADDKRGKFLQDLNPNNALYTPTQKPKILTPEQKQRRMDFVNKLMTVYKQCETDQNYESRAKNEERNMRLVNEIQYSASNGRIEMLSGTASIMNLLYAAQNLSLDGQTDYVSVLIDQPIVSDFLMKMRNGKALEIMEQKAQERKSNGTLSNHKPTYWEVANRNANALISEHPNAVDTVRKKLQQISTFTIQNGDIENLRRAHLISIFAMTQGQELSRTTDSQGNRILKIGVEHSHRKNGEEQSV